MSIEIEIKGGMFRMSRCARCFYLAESASANEVIMVGPTTETAKKTGWGDSSNFGRISVAFDNAKPVVMGGRVHLIVPVAKHEISISGEESIGDVFFKSLGHDLKSLP